MVQSIIDRLAGGDEAGALSHVRDLGWPEESDGLGEVLPIIRRLALGAEFTHSGARTLRLARQFLDHLFHHLPEMGRPLRVFTQMDRFVGAYGARSLLLESLTSNPRALDLLWHVFEGSRVLGEEIIMNPGLFDEVVSGAGLEEEIDSERLIGAVMDQESAEEGWNALRRIKRGERFRLGLRYLESIDAEEALLNQFSALADAVVEAGLRLVASQIDLPEGLEFHVLAFGKWGGGEIGFGGDLDLIYLGEGPDPVFLQRLAARFGRQMEQHSASGRLFELDPRLRPYGSDGPLVTNRDALIQYFERDARNWERLAWTRARRVAGTCPWDGGQAGFEDFRRNCIRSSGWSEQWLQEMMEMRNLIARERLKGERSSVMDFKSGEGGLLDIEFLGQLATVRNACIAHRSGQDPLPNSTLEMLDLAEADGWFPEHDDAEFARRHYRNLRRYEQLMRIWDERSHSAFPAEEEDLRSLALHMGFQTSEELIARHRADCARCRAIYLKAMEKQGM
jgi:glutamate-ammonia-ligase adenylyltransferase